jgi:hypothetical protein
MTSKVTVNLIQPRPCFACGLGAHRRAASPDRSLEILAELRAIEQEILQGIEELEGML